MEPQWDTTELRKIQNGLDGIKDDNRIENLQLATDDRHNGITILENRIKRLENILSKNNIGF